MLQNIEVSSQSAVQDEGFVTGDIKKHSWGEMVWCMWTRVLQQRCSFSRFSANKDLTRTPYNGKYKIRRSELGSRALGGWEGLPSCLRLRLSQSSDFHEGASIISLMQH